MTPTFSVIVPTYNRAELVTRTLATVFGQNYPAHEIIVVDNCSTDATVDLLRPFADQGRIVLIENERNVERAASRNIGMRHATGEYVTFLDSDDLMYPRNLADAAGFVGRFPESRLFHNLYEIVTGDGTLIRSGRFPSIKDPVTAIASGNFMSCIGNFVHRDLYQCLAFDPDLVGSEDWEFWMRAIARAGLGRIPRVNSGLVEHNARSATHFDLQSMSARLDRVLAKVESDPELSHAYGHDLDRLRASCKLLLASAANSCGRHSDAGRFLGEAFRARTSAICRDAFVRIAVRALSGAVLGAVRA